MLGTAQQASMSGQWQLKLVTFSTESFSFYCCIYIPWEMQVYPYINEH